jgi:hypothetical protein
MGYCIHFRCRSKSGKIYKANGVVCFFTLPYAYRNYNTLTYFPRVHVQPVTARVFLTNFLAEIPRYSRKYIRCGVRNNKLYFRFRLDKLSSMRGILLLTIVRMLDEDPDGVCAAVEDETSGSFWKKIVTNVTVPGHHSIRSVESFRSPVTKIDAESELPYVWKLMRKHVWSMNLQQLFTFNHPRD